MTNHILLVEDDRKLAPLIKRFLTDQHFQVDWVVDGGLGWQQFLALQPDLVILDLMLPGKDGLSLCREMRLRSQVGILILTAKGDEADRVLGLELGADDYLSKPFGFKELLARCKAVLRRYQLTTQTDGRRCIGPFVLYLEQRQLYKDDSLIELTRSEFDILELLTARPGRVLSRDDLLERVKGGETQSLDRAIDTHISNLRKKIETDPKMPRYIMTVWGVGYRFAA